MNSLEISAFVFTIISTGAMAGMAIQTYLPQHHRDADTKAVVQLVMGLIATMAALLLSLLIASAHTFYDTQQSEVQQLGVNIILLDDVLARYGHETDAIRALVKSDVSLMIQEISPTEGVGSIALAPQAKRANSVGVLEQVEALPTATPAQTYDKNAALGLLSDIANERLLIHEQSLSTVPKPIFVVMVVWLVGLFFSFGLFARRNPTIIVAMLSGAVSVAAAIFLILDLSQPYSGMTRVSLAPIQSASAQIDR